MMEKNRNKKILIISIISFILGFILFFTASEYADGFCEDRGFDSYVDGKCYYKEILDDGTYINKHSGGGMDKNSYNNYILINTLGLLFIIISVIGVFCLTENN